MGPTRKKILAVKFPGLSRPLGKRMSQAGHLNSHQYLTLQLNLGSDRAATVQMFPLQTKMSVELQAKITISTKEKMRMNLNWLHLSLESFKPYAQKRVRLHIDNARLGPEWRYVARAHRQSSGPTASHPRTGHPSQHSRRQVPGPGPAPECQSRCSITGRVSKVTRARVHILHVCATVCINCIFYIFLAYFCIFFAYFAYCQ